MRIVKDGANIIYAIIDGGHLNYSSGNPVYHKDDTIELTDEEIDEIYDGYEEWLDKEWQKVYKQVGKKGYHNWAYFHRYHQYLKDLIELKDCCSDEKK